MIYWFLSPLSLPPCLIFFLLQSQEKLSVLDFVDKDVSNIKPEEPLPLEDTPFKIVGDVKDLKILAAKLRSVDEFAVRNLIKRNLLMA